MKYRKINQWIITAEILLFAMYSTKQFVHVHKNCVITPLLIINHLTHSILLFTFLLINHYIHKFLLILSYHGNFVNCHYYGKLWIPSIIIKVFTNPFSTKFNFTSNCFKCVINRIPFLPIQIKNLFKRFLISSRDKLSHDQFEALDWLARTPNYICRGKVQRWSKIRILSGPELL